MYDDYDTYMAEGEEYVLLSFDNILRITDGAVLFDLGDKNQWVPVRHIDLQLFNPNEQEDKLFPVKVWFARNNGLI